MRFGPGIESVKGTDGGAACDFGGRPRLAPGRLGVMIFCVFGAIELVTIELVGRACQMGSQPGG